VRRIAVAALAGIAAAAFASSARATNECRGLQVCVPVAGPWVVTPGVADVRYQLACPRRFVVGGLDGELTTRNLDVAFRGGLGSPVNPGITTSTSAVFLGRLLARGGPAAFRPHIGCIPAAGGGQRFPTVHRAFPPAKPLAPTAVQLTVLPGVHRFVERCPAGRHLTAATHAVGFYTTAPPSAAQMQSIGVVQSAQGDRVVLVVRAGALPSHAVLQVDLDCTGAA
jgi:hypothetical protein